MLENISECLGHRKETARSTLDEPLDPARLRPSKAAGRDRKTVVGLLCLCNAANLVNVSASIGLSDVMQYSQYTPLGLEVTYQGSDASLRSPRLQMGNHVGGIVAMAVFTMPQYSYLSKSKAPAAEDYFK